MPAKLDDPTAPVIYRRSGAGPYPTPSSPLPADVVPRQVTLRDRITKATLIPFSSPDQVPHTLMAYLCSQLNKEIEKGDTYPMLDPLTLDAFAPYWLSNFAAVMLLGEVQDQEEVLQKAHRGCDWEKECLGSFYIKPNYTGRSSHVCNGAFLVTDGVRNRGVGRLMGEGYLDWAPKLGYTYSVFNLVYETNTPTCRIFDALGFKRIGRVKGCGNLKSYPNQLIDAIVYGRDLGPSDEDVISEERFDRIKFYLKHQRYPDGADRAEKSRLRSASTHYKLLPATDTEPEKLVLKGKEVIADPQKQYDVARRVHMEQHGGINKTTATITERYHWVRIKDTVTQVIKNCPACKEPQAKMQPGKPRQDESPPPFNRDFSIPPGERWISAYGEPNASGAVLPNEAHTPRPHLNEPEEEQEEDEDADAPHEDEDVFNDLMGHNSILDGLPNLSEEHQVPVDPLLLDIVDSSGFDTLEQAVTHLQRTQVYGTSMIAPSQMQVPPDLAPTARRKRSSKASPENERRSTTQRQLAPQPQPDDELHKVIHVASPRGSKRKSAAGTDGEFRRVTRRSGGAGPPQAGHVSEDAWRRQIFQHSSGGGDGG